MTRAGLEAAAQAAIEQRLAAVERATGVEVVTALVERADSYPEIPWRAFALGASLASCAAAGAALLEPGWDGALAVGRAMVATLATGAAAALATVWIAPFARLFLPRARAEAESLQYARSLFLESGLHRTQRRDAVLLLATRFERQVVIWADDGVRERVGEADLAPVLSAMAARLRVGQPAEALLDGLERLESVLAAGGFRSSGEEVNELADSVIQTRGAT